jgi:hypothetical protein
LRNILALLQGDIATRNESADVLFSLSLLAGLLLPDLGQSLFAGLKNFEHGGTPLFRLDNIYLLYRHYTPVAPGFQAGG